MKNGTVKTFSGTEYSSPQKRKCLEEAGALPERNIQNAKQHGFDEKADRF
jgi:division protein CdvB (Snf7/Vps24/ESCRT-III family)